MDDFELDETDQWWYDEERDCCVFYDYDDYDDYEYEEV